MQLAVVRRVSAGQLDAALSAVATLVIGLYAVRALEAPALGAYGLVFSAWNLARSVASEMVFVPSEVLAVARQAGKRVEILTSSIARGMLISVGAALAFMITYPILVGRVASDTAIALTATGCAVTLVAPLQEHWRRVLHIDDASWRAALISVVHLVATIGSMGVLSRLASPAWVPFGSLGLGFTTSMAAAFLLTRPLIPSSPSVTVTPRWNELVGMGRWLFGANFAVLGSDFLLNVMIMSILGIEILGFGEGARVVARTVVILGIGLNAVLGPKSMEAAMTRDLASARRLRTLFWRVSLLGGVVYLPLVGTHWDLNLLSPLLPNAYAVEGLVAVAIVSSMAFNHGLPWRSELLGGRRLRQVALSEGISSLAKLGIGLAASTLGAFTLPVAWATAWLVRNEGLRRATGRLYAEDRGPEGRFPSSSDLGRPHDEV